MRKLLTILFVLLSFSGIAQIWTKPNNSIGTIANGIGGDRFVYIPTGCGAPTSPANYDSSLKRAGVYFDSCNTRLFIYSPKNKTWGQLIGSGGGGHDDTIYVKSPMQIRDSINGVDTGYIFSIAHGDSIFIHAEIDGDSLRFYRMDGSDFAVSLPTMPDTVLNRFERVGDSLRVKRLNGTYQSVYAPVAGSGWLLTGNAGTTPGTNFLGTTDNQDLVFKRNNVTSGRIGTDNTFFGNNSGASSSGTNNTYLGIGAGNSNNGNNNTFSGLNSGFSSIGSYNTGYGANSAVSLSGSFCAAGGYGAGNNSTGSYNTMFGYSAGSSNTRSYVTAIGDSAAVGNTYRSIIALGRRASANANYQFAIYDSITHFRIPGFVSATDTSDWKPMAFNPTTKVAKYLPYWPSTGSTGSVTDSASFHNISQPNDSTVLFNRPNGTADTLVIAGLSPAYKKYVATVYINASTIDSVKVRENTLGGSVTWSYGGLAGLYNSTSSSLFTIGKTMVDIMSVSGTGFSMSRVILDASTINYTTFSGLIGFQDDYIGAIDIEIRVYY